MLAESVGLPASMSMQIDVPVCCEKCTEPTPTPSTTPPVPPQIQFSLVRCVYDDKLVPWIPPLRCGFHADAFPAGAQLLEAVIRLEQVVKVNATMKNAKDTPITGEYTLCVFNSVEPAEWFNATCPDNLKHVDNVTVEPKSWAQVYFESEPLIACLESTPSFVEEAQALVDAGEDVTVEFKTDSEMYARRFSGASLDRALACGDVELMVFYTLPS
eukprot:CAMPEP_0185846774 /NCGR_PEP_ID=MMETSP1354-20130828/2301_1 /TAXON_ID=708628 /ORGANISM="Erythrolobus madagascarensis, Strain CCMP3276" /LENGTH=214 /DNA_ID=CAMNT_0028546979 /DNA_START=610 /DNA_END=1254 /DNA_ORIENTATION=+